MKIEIKANGFDPGTRLLEFATYCVGFELGSQRNQITSVGIELSVVDEPWDGKDKRCCVQIDLHGRHEVIEQTVGFDFHFAIFQALERAGWMIARGLDHKHGNVSHLPIMERPVASHHEPDRAA